MVSKGSNHGTARGAARGAATGTTDGKADPPKATGAPHLTGQEAIDRGADGRHSRSSTRGRQLIDGSDTLLRRTVA